MIAFTVIWIVGVVVFGVIATGLHDRRLSTVTDTLEIALAVVLWPVVVPITVLTFVADELISWWMT